MEVTFTNVGFLEDKELGAACEVNLESVAIYAEGLVRSVQHSCVQKYILSMMKGSNLIYGSRKVIEPS